MAPPRVLSKLLFSITQVNGCVRVTSLQPPSQGQHLHSLVNTNSRIQNPNSQRIDRIDTGAFARTGLATPRYPSSKSSRFGRYTVRHSAEGKCSCAKFTRSPPPNFGWGTMIELRQHTGGIKPYPNLQRSYPGRCNSSPDEIVAG